MESVVTGYLGLVLERVRRGMIDWVSDRETRVEEKSKHWDIGEMSDMRDECADTPCLRGCTDVPAIPVGCDKKRF